jgi:Mrp family chromosome partitioning ATPase
MATAESRLSRSVALGDYVRMIWQRRWIVAAAVLLATVLAIVTRPAEPTALYTATVTLRVQTYTFTGAGDTSLTPQEGIPPAEVEAARSVDVAAQTADEIGDTDGGASILARLGVSAEENTDLLRMSLTGEGLDTVETLEAYAQNYVEYRQEQDGLRLQRALETVNVSIAEVGRELARFSTRLEVESASGGASPETQTKYNTVSAIYTDLLSRKQLLRLEASLAGDQVEVIGSPIVQRVGTIPARTLRTLAGPLVGFLLGSAIAVAVGVLRPRVSGRDRTEEQLGYPVLAVIPRVKNRRMDKDPLVVQRASGWGAEGIRMLRTELQLVEERGAELKVVVIASPEPRDGKSTVSSNLAASYATAGRNAVLVHADLRAARRHKQQGPGLTDFIAGDTPEIPVHRSPGGFAEVLPGSNMHQGGAVQERLTEAIRELRGSYDVVVVDTPPLLAFADALLLAAEADAVVVVVRDGKTLEDKAAEALEVLVRHDAAVAGLVLNGARVGRLERRRYRRYYGSWTETVGSPEAVPVEDTAAPPPPPPVEQVASLRHVPVEEEAPAAPRALFRRKRGDEVIGSGG